VTADDAHDAIVMFLFSGCWSTVSTVLFDVGEARSFMQLPAPTPSKGLNMQSTRRLRAAALVALSVVPFISAASFAANGPVFINGQSIYGQPAAQGTPVRVVDLAAADRLKVAYGESVVFRNGAQQFSWTFNGLDRRSVDVSQIAPAGFASKPFAVQVGRSWANRH